MPRLDGETGTYLGLVGTRLKGIDTVYGSQDIILVEEERRIYTLITDIMS